MVPDRCPIHVVVAFALRVSSGKLPVEGGWRILPGPTMQACATACQRCCASTIPSATQTCKKQQHCRCPWAVWGCAVLDTQPLQQSRCNRAAPTVGRIPQVPDTPGGSCFQEGADWNRGIGATHVEGDGRRFQSSRTRTGGFRVWFSVEGIDGNTRRRPESTNLSARCPSVLRALDAPPPDAFYLSLRVTARVFPPLPQCCWPSLRCVRASKWDLALESATTGICCEVAWEAEQQHSEDLRIEPNQWVGGWDTEKTNLHQARSGNARAHSLVERTKNSCCSRKLLFHADRCFVLPSTSQRARLVVFRVPRRWANTVHQCWPTGHLTTTHVKNGASSISQ